MKVFSILCVLAVFVATCNGNICEPGWFRLGNDCFITTLSVNGTHRQARELCRGIDSKADLAVIKSASTLRGLYMYFVDHKLDELCELGFWLGGSDKEWEGNWLWHDGSRIAQGTPFWALHKKTLGYELEPLGEENENCLLLDHKRNWYMDDRDCSSNHYPLCMMKSTA